MIEVTHSLLRRPAAWCLLVATFASTGCSTYAIPRYSVSAPNVATLRTMRGQSINVGAFSARDGASEVLCRGVGPIKTPDGEEFSEYVRAALISELLMAEVWSASAPVTLTGVLDDVGFDSFAGAWALSLTVTSSNGQSLHVAEKYPFQTSFYGETACNQVAQAFMPGVQDLIAKLVRDPAFKALVGAPNSAAAPNAKPGSKCALRVGRYEWRSTERPGGTCGARKAVIGELDSQPTEVKPPCTGSISYSNDNCKVVFESSCPATNGLRVTRGVATWSPDATQGRSSEDVFVKAEDGSLVCSSSYDVTVERQ